MKNGIKVFLFVLVGLLSLYVVTAVPYGANSVTAGTSERYDTSGILPANVSAQAGNVTQLNISSIAITTSWQGFYGNITGSLVLADASSNNFYDWNLSSPSGEVYASRSNAVSWVDINCSTPTNITAEETALGQAAADPDSVSNTFAVATHPTFAVGAVTIGVNNCSATQAYNNAGVKGTGFYQVLLSDKTNTVYTTILDATPEEGFNNNQWDFQLLVGENGKPGSPAATPYYFYVELQ